MVAAIILCLAVLVTRYTANGQENDICATDYDCSNQRGYCSYDVQSGSYVCRCYYGYYGRRCEYIAMDVTTTDYKKKDACTKDYDCTNRRGYCHNDLSYGVYVCRCYYGYYGRLCQNCVGSCDDDITKAVTSLPQSTTTKDYKICHVNYCSKHGACFYNSDGLWCVCDEGYEGEYCGDIVHVVNIEKLKRAKLATVITVYTITSIVVLVSAIVVMCMVCNTWDSSCRRKSEQAYRDSVQQTAELRGDAGTWLSNEDNIQTTSLQRTLRNDGGSGDTLQITPGNLSGHLPERPASERPLQLHGMEPLTGPLTSTTSPRLVSQYDDLPPSYVDITNPTSPGHGAPPGGDHHGPIDNVHASEPSLIPTAPPPSYEFVVGIQPIENNSPPNTDVTNTSHTSEHYI